MQITKVKLTPSTTQVLDLLDTSVFPADTPYAKNGATWWIVKVAGQAVGFCGLKLWNDSTAFLCRAGVLKSHRGLGLHRKMLKVRERAAKVMGVRLVVTYTSPTNLRSANNLVKSGYLLYTPQAKWGCEGALYFRKTIN